MAFLVLVAVPTIIAFTVLITVELALKALAIELQAFGPFAVTSHFLLLLNALLFSVLRRQYLMKALALALLRE